MKEIGKEHVTTRASSTAQIQSLENMMKDLRKEREADARKCKAEIERLRQDRKTTKEQSYNLKGQLKALEAVSAEQIKGLEVRLTDAQHRKQALEDQINEVKTEAEKRNRLKSVFIKIR